MILDYFDYCCHPEVAESLPAASSQRMIEALGRFHIQSLSIVSISLSIYDLADQQTLYATSSVATLLGYPADAACVMESLGLANLIHVNDLERVAEHYQHLTTLQAGEVIEVEYRMKRADDTWCLLRSQETPLILAADGFPLQVLGMLQDLTPVSRTKTTRTRRATLLSRAFERCEVS